MTVTSFISSSISYAFANVSWTSISPPFMRGVGKGWTHGSRRFRFHPYPGHDTVCAKAKSMPKRVMSRNYMI